MIKQTKNGWTLFSHKGRELGTYNSYSDAVKREKEILYFKNRRDEDKS